jgi:hypothetical protein
MTYHLFGRLDIENLIGMRQADNAVTGHQKYIADRD